MTSLQPLKHVAEVHFSNVDKKSVDGQVGVRLCNYTDVYYNDMITADLEFMEATATSAQVAVFGLRPGDVLLTKDSETADDIGVGAFVPEPLPGVLCGYHLAIARPRPGGVEGRYLHWALSSAFARQQLEVAATGVTRFGLRQDAVASILLPVPSPAEQRATARFLDAETARIDAMVQARQRQVELVSERTNAMIHMLVTQGSRPSELTQLGPGWAGRIPPHWGLPPVGALFEVQLGKMVNPDSTQSDDKYPYLRNVNVQWDRIDLDDLNEMHFDASDRLRYALKPGDLLVCEGGEVGRAAVWSGAPGAYYYQKALHRLRPMGDASARYLMYALWAASSRGVFENEGNTSTIVHLTAEKLGAHRFPWPPRTEQDEIVRELDLVRDEAERLCRLLARQVTVLQERRQALITAAVTGQLDIPGVAA